MQKTILLLCCMLVGFILKPSDVTAAAKAATPMCTNSVSAGVYLDANNDRVREPNESFLAGMIEILDSVNVTVATFQSTNGLFVLDDVACAEYTVYHNSNYVGKLQVSNVMGQPLVELPKTQPAHSLWLPMINNEP